MTISSGSMKYLQNDEENRTLRDRDSREIDSLPLEQVKHNSQLVRIKEHLWADVDPDQSSLPLACYCFMTGFMCVLKISPSCEKLIIFFLKRLSHIYRRIRLVWLPNGQFWFTEDSVSIINPAHSTQGNTIEVIQICIFPCLKYLRKIKRTVYTYIIAFAGSRTSICNLRSSRTEFPDYRPTVTYLYSIVLGWFFLRAHRRQNGLKVTDLAVPGYISAGFVYYGRCDSFVQRETVQFQYTPCYMD